MTLCLIKHKVNYRFGIVIVKTINKQQLYFVILKEKQAACTALHEFAIVLTKLYQGPVEFTTEYNYDILLCSN